MNSWCLKKLATKAGQAKKKYQTAAKTFRRGTQAHHYSCAMCPSFYPTAKWQNNKADSRGGKWYWKPLKNTANRADLALYIQAKNKRLGFLAIEGFNENPNDPGNQNSQFILYPAWWTNLLYLLIIIIISLRLYESINQSLRLSKHYAQTFG